MPMRRYKIGTGNEKEKIQLPAEIAIAKLIQDAYNEQADIIMVELPFLVKDVEFVEKCLEDLECRLQVHRIAYETAVEILHHILDKTAREMWQLFETEIRKLEAQSKALESSIM